jgi:hypothetical protein
VSHVRSYKTVDVFLRTFRHASAFLIPFRRGLPYVGVAIIRERAA